MKRHDIELLSAYLDGELKRSDLAKTESRLKSDPEFESAMKDLRATRTLLRRLPTRKAPRNFTLTREMVGQNPPLPRIYPIFRLATVVATLLFFFSIGVNSFGAQMASQDYAYGMGGGGGGDSFSEQQAPAFEEPAAPESELYSSVPATEEPSVALAPSQAADAAPTEDASRSMGTEALKLAEAEGAVGLNQSPALLVPPTWQITLVAIALAGLVLMVLMRQLSARRWQ